MLHRVVSGNVAGITGDEKTGFFASKRERLFNGGSF